MLQLATAVVCSSASDAVFCVNYTSNWWQTNDKISRFNGAIFVGWQRPNLHDTSNTNVGMGRQGHR